MFKQIFEIAAGIRLAKAFDPPDPQIQGEGTVELRYLRMKSEQDDKHISILKELVKGLLIGMQYLEKHDQTLTAENCADVDHAVSQAQLILEQPAFGEAHRLEDVT
jgi:hypothetical protein